MLIKAETVTLALNLIEYTIRVQIVLFNHKEVVPYFFPEYNFPRFWRIHSAGLCTITISDTDAVTRRVTLNEEETSLVVRQSARTLPPKVLCFPYSTSKMP